MFVSSALCKTSRKPLLANTARYFSSSVKVNINVNHSSSASVSRFQIPITSGITSNATTMAGLNAVRSYATGSQGSGSQGSGSQGSGSGSGKFKILLLLALLAGGSSIAAATYTSKPPLSAVEPSNNAVFKPGDISVIFVLGGPGSGKGTQCEKLVNDFDFVHLSAGDLLREEQKRPGSEFGKIIDQHIREGTIVPQEITLKLLENAIKHNFTTLQKTRFLIDGFPRKMDQALSFEENISPSAFTLFFECPESVMLDRILQRGKTSGRADDNVDSIKKRFKTFKDTSMPVVDYFDKQGKVIKLSCNKTKEAVHADVKAALESKLNIK